MPQIEPGTQAEDLKQTRQMNELLSELRIALPGVQVLFAFLLAVAFTDRFERATELQRATFFAVLVSTAAAAAFFIAPAAAHRLRFHGGDRTFLIEHASRMMIVGLAFMTLSMVGMVALVTEVMYGGTASAVTSAAVAALFVGLWFGVPIARGIRVQRARSRASTGAAGGPADQR